MLSSCSRTSGLVTPIVIIWVSLDKWVRTVVACPHAYFKSTRIVFSQLLLGCVSYESLNLVRYKTPDSPNRVICWNRNMPPQLYLRVAFLCFYTLMILNDVEPFLDKKKLVRIFLWCSPPPPPSLAEKTFPGTIFLVFAELWLFVLVFWRSCDSRLFKLLTLACL